MAVEDNGDIPAPGPAGLAEKPPPTGAADHHPSGKESYGKIMQILRGAAFGTYFTSCLVLYVSSGNPARGRLRPYSLPIRSD